MTRIRSRLAAASAAWALTALVLVGCAGEPPALEPSTAQQLQGDVLEVTEAAVAGDLEQARSLLSHAEANLRTAASSGQVTPERSADIQAAINLVSTDLTAAIEAAEAQAASDAQDRADADAAAAAEEAAAQAAEEAKQAAEDAKQAEEDAKDNEDKDCKGKDCDD